MNCAQPSVAASPPRGEELPGPSRGEELPGPSVPQSSAGNLGTIIAIVLHC